MKENSENLEEVTVCPSIEELNAFYDGELIDSEITVHLKNCLTCQDIIKFYREVDTAVLGEHKINNLPFSVMRVKSQLKVEIAKERQARQKKNKRIITWLCRVAAVLAIGTYCSFMFNEINASNSVEFAVQKSKNDISDSLNRGSTKFVKIVKNVAQRLYNQQLISYQNEITEAKYKTLMRDLYAYKKQDRMSSGVQLKDFNLAGYGESANHEMSEALFTELKSEAPVMINPQVRHVWIGNDFDTMNEYFENARQAAVMNEVVETSSSEHGFKFQIITTKAKLVEFVKSLNVQGLKLLSSQAPQPEQKTFFGNGEDQVVYSAEFVAVD